MAWPATVQPGQTATAAQYNALVAALAAWGGDVDAGAHALTNVARLAAVEVDGQTVKVSAAAHTLTITDRGDGYVLHRDDSGYYLFGDASVDLNSIVGVYGKNQAAIAVERDANNWIQVLCGVSPTHHGINGSGALDVNIPLTATGAFTANQGISSNGGINLYGALQVFYKDSSNYATARVWNSASDGWVQLYFDETSFGGYTIPTLFPSVPAAKFFGYCSIGSGLNCNGAIHGVGEVAAFNANWAGTPGIYLRAADANHGNQGTLQTSSGQVLLLTGPGVAFTSAAGTGYNESNTWKIYDGGDAHLYLYWKNSSGQEQWKVLI